MHCLGNDCPTFKVVLIGDSGVGKTCLQSRFCEKGFPTNTCATVGVEFGSRYMFLNDRKIQLQLWDTAGMECYRKSMPKLYYRNASAILFVYDMTNVKTFNSIRHWIQECHVHQGNSHLVWLLIGNKCDCVNNIAVSTKMAEQFAKQHNMKLYEISAKDEEECRSMLFELTRDLDSQHEFVEENSAKICFVPGFREPIIIKRRTQAQKLQSLEKSGIISESDSHCHCP